MKKKLFVVSDVHGHCTLLKEALEKAGITEIALKSESWNKGLGMVTLTVEIANDGTLTIKCNDPSILEE